MGLNGAILVALSIAPIVVGQCNRNATSCGQCVDIDPNCAWCDSVPAGQFRCDNGNVFSGNACGSRCNGETCKVNTCEVSQVVLWHILVPVAAGLLIIGAIALYCCCCRGRTARRVNKALEKEDRIRHREALEREDHQDKRRKERQNKAEHYKQKWNIGQNTAPASTSNPLHEPLVPTSDPYAENSNIA